MVTHNREGTQNLELLPEEERVHTPHQTPQFLWPAPERWAPPKKHLTLKTNRACTHSTYGAVVNWGHMHRPVNPRAQCRSSSLKSMKTSYARDSFGNWSEGLGTGGMFSRERGHWMPISWSPSALLKLADAISFSFLFIWLYFLCLLFFLFFSLSFFLLKWMTSLCLPLHHLSPDSGYNFHTISLPCSRASVSPRR